MLIITAHGPGARKHQETRTFLGMSPRLDGIIGGLIAEGLVKNFAESGV